MLKEVKLGLAGTALIGATYFGFTSYEALRDAERRLQSSPEYGRLAQLDSAIAKLEDARRATDAFLARSALSEALRVMGDQGSLDDAVRGAYHALHEDDAVLARQQPVIADAVRQLTDIRERQSAGLPLDLRLAKGVCGIGLGLAAIAGLVALGYGITQLRKEQ